jgi:hypothetical protein
MSSTRSNGPARSSRASSVTSPRITRAFETPPSLAVARSIAAGTASTPVASHPCSARYRTFVPVPHPRSSARPGATAEGPSTSSTTSGGVTPVSQGVRPVRYIHRNAGRHISAARRTERRGPTRASLRAARRGSTPRIDRRARRCRPPASPAPGRRRRASRRAAWPRPPWPAVRRPPSSRRRSACRTRRWRPGRGEPR